MKRVLVAAVASMALSAGSADSASPRRWLPDVNTVALTNVNVRYGPGTTYDVAFQIRKGEPVSVDSIHGDWCMVNSAEGQFALCRYLKPPKGGWVVGQTVKQSCWPKCGD